MKIINYLIFLIFLHMSALAFAGRGHLEFTVGAARTNYSETHELQPTLDTKLSQYAPNTRLNGNFVLFPNWLYTGFDTQYIGPVLTSSEGDSMTFLNYDAHLGWRIPSRPFNLLLEAQYFVVDMSPTSPAFGHKDLIGTRIMGIADLQIPSTKMNIYAKMPIWIEIERLKQFWAGITFHLIESAEKGVPINYLRGSIVNFEYSRTTLSVADPRKVAIRYETLAMSIGYNW